eukprot:410415-Prymnesium_polylepis.1
MLSSRRHRAGRFDVGTLSTGLGFDLATAESVIAHGLLRLERAPAMDGCTGTWSIGWTPYAPRVTLTAYTALYALALRIDD